MRLIQLDLLRAAAVLLVLGSHLPAPAADHPACLTAVAGFFLRYGSLGVDLFFVLSGFLVSGLLFREHRQRGAINLGRFLVRRGLKIYPAFYVFLVVTVLLRIERGDTFTAAQLLCEGFFVQNYGPGVWTHTWSLAVEEHFYLLLAGLVALLLAFSPKRAFKGLPVIFLGVTALATCLRLLTWQSAPHSPKSLRFPTHLQIDSLLFGVLLAYLFHLKASFAPLVMRFRPCLLVFSFASLVVPFWVMDDGTRYVFGAICLYAGFGGLVLVAVTTPAPAKGAFAWPIRVLGYIGAHSYSIYLWHTAVLVFGLLLARKLLGGEPGYYTVLVGYLLLSIGFGVVMAKAVELPVLSLRERLFPSTLAAPRRETALAPLVSDPDQQQRELNPLDTRAIPVPATPAT